MLYTQLRIDHVNLIFLENNMESLLLFICNLRRVNLMCSLWDYTNVVMNFLFGSHTTDDGSSLSFDWLEYFDVVVTGRLFLYLVERPCIYSTSTRICL